MKNSFLDKFTKYFPTIRTLRKKRLISFLLAFLLTLLSLRAIIEFFTIQIPIFGFHDIVNLQEASELPPRRQSFDNDYSQQDLEVFLEALVRDNYWFLSTQELYDYFLSEPKKPLPSERQKQKRVMITFDDGYQSAYTHVLPILEKLYKKYGRKPKVVLFVNPAFIGNRGAFSAKIRCQELREGLHEGFYDIQSHGLQHQDLTKLSVKQLEKELSESQSRLRKCTQGLDPNQTVAAHIAYPFGAVNNLVEQYASRYYQSGYVYNSLTLKIRGRAEPYRISRLTINQNKSVKKLLRLAEGGWLNGLLGNRILEML